MFMCETVIPGKIALFAKLKLQLQRQMFKRIVGFTYCFYAPGKMCQVWDVSSQYSVACFEP